MSTLTVSGQVNYKGVNMTHRVVITDVEESLCKVYEHKLSREGYFVRMRGCGGVWDWRIIPRNGKEICCGNVYENRTQCRNVAKKFADAVGLRWREE